MIDCLIIGQHDPDFEQHLRTLQLTFGSKSGAYQDQDLTFITYQGRPYRAMDLLNLINRDQLASPLSNMDFLWPTIPALASFLVKHGLTFDYVNQFKYEKEILARKLRTNEYRTIAISTTLYVVSTPIREIVNFIRAQNSKALIVAGGPYFRNRCVENSTYQLDMEFTSIDADIYVNSSEGQMALVNVIKALKAGDSLRGIENVIYRKTLSNGSTRANAAAATASGAPQMAQPVEETSFVFNPTATEDNPLEQNPVDFELFPRSDLGRFVSIATAKSCPYACAFCGFPSRAGDYRYLDVGLVEKQLNKLKDLGIDTITFLDDTFNVPKARFRQLLEMMIRNRYGFHWNSFYRSDQGDDEIIGLMAEAGCEGVFLGTESGSDEILQKMNKTARTRHYSAAIPALRRNGIYMHANFIIGFPGETAETAQQTLDFILRHEPDTYKAQLWYADNTTPVWKRKDELKIEGIGFNWSHYTMDSNQAAEWIDLIHEKVTKSAFLPQEGFGLWSIFYLQRKGMPRQQVLDFLKRFGRGVLLKRKDAARQEIPAQLARELFALGRLPQATPVSDRELAARV